MKTLVKLAWDVKRGDRILYWLPYTYTRVTCVRRSRDGNTVRVWVEDRRGATQLAPHQLVETVDTRDW